MKLLVSTVSLAMLTVVVGATDARATPSMQRGPVHTAPGVAPVYILPPTWNPIQYHPNGCPAAQANGRRGVEPSGCLLYTPKGLIQIRFDRTGMPTEASGTDNAGVIHSYQVSNFTIAPTKYHGTITDHYITFYENWKKVGRARVMQDIGNRHASYSSAVYDASGAEYEDYCDVWYHHAEAVPEIMENPQFMPSNNGVLLTHFDTMGRHHEKAKWYGVGTPPVKCGSYLPWQYKADFFADVLSTYANVQNVQDNLDNAYRQYGITLRTNPVDIFHAVHETRLNYGIHPLDLDSGQWHQVGNIAVGLVAGAVATGLLIVGAAATGGAAVPLELSVITYFVTFDGTVVGEVIYDYCNERSDDAKNNGPQSLNDDYGYSDSDFVDMGDGDYNTDTSDSADANGGDLVNDGTGGGGDDPGDGSGGCDNPDTCNPPPNANAIHRIRE